MISGLKLMINKLLLAILALSLSRCSQIAFAEIDQNKAVEAILGESGPTHAERLAIACALRNRGTLHGVYGHRKPASDRERQEAIRIWSESKKCPTALLGAKYWLSDYDLKHCRKVLTAFRFKMKEVAYIGHTHFFREVKKGVK